MTTEICGQTRAEQFLATVTNHFKKHPIWMRCPRCVGGNMYKEHTGEYVCLQCGCTYYQDKVTITSSTN